jgi:hypothetical protein
MSEYPYSNNRSEFNKRLYIFQKMNIAQTSLCDAEETDYLGQNGSVH